MMKLAPNFEMTMYLAQATGSCIVTDSPFRWTEIKSAIRQRAGILYPGLAALARDIERSDFAFPQNVRDIAAFSLDETFATFPALMRDLFKYLSNLGIRGQKPNREAQLNGRFVKTHAPVQNAIKKTRVPTKAARISCVFPVRGIQDNTVNRLLLMSSSESHLSNVPMAFSTTHLTVGAARRTHRLRFIPETWVTLLARRGSRVVRACMSDRRSRPNHSP
jgi:hypothetical protein